jgi:SAM-dependent methyltransferase
MDDFFYYGFPLKKKFKLLINSSSFEKLRGSSDHFLKSNKEILEDYSKKWVENPFYQWSRQWEYPYALDQISNYLNANGEKNISILDAGSGATFFPFFINERYPISQIICIDNDPLITDIFNNLNQNLAKKVAFQNSDLNKLPLENGSIDLIYCISVLEHTENYSEIISEFLRVLKPNGKLIITIDISIDRQSEILPEEADNLFKSLTEYFIPVNQFNNIRLSEICMDKLIYRTTDAFKIDPELLPWKNKIQSLNFFQRFFNTSRGIQIMTFNCQSFTRK